MGAISDHGIAAHCRGLDWLHTVVIGFFENGVLRGSAELCIERGKVPRAGELAVTVETPWQGHGVGTELLRRGLVAAANRGVTAASMICLLDNRPIQRIAQKLKFQLSLRDGEAGAAIIVPSPTQLSLLEETVGEGLGLWADAWGRVVAGFGAAAKPRGLAPRA
jgi:GNAT superfamily N-acetyltransferase